MLSYTGFSGKVQFYLHQQNKKQKHKKIRKINRKEEKEIAWLEQFCLYQRKQQKLKQNKTNSVERSWRQIVRLPYNHHTIQLV